MNPANSRQPTGSRHHIRPQLSKIQIAGAKLRRVSSEIGTKGPLFHSVVSNDEAPVDTANLKPKPHPLQASLYPLESVAVRQNSRFRWAGILPIERPTELGQDIQAGDGLKALDFDQHLTPPTGSLRSPARARNNSCPLDPCPNVNPRIQTSPAPAVSTPVANFHERNPSRSTRAPEWYNTFIPMAPVESPASATTRITSPTETFYSVEQLCERKMLIIGSDYRDRTKRCNTRLSIGSLQSLHALQNDIDDMESTFGVLGYEIEILTPQEFTRDEILTRVAAFMASALPGDVRAIVFSGHSIMTRDHSPCILLPGISDNIFISAKDWKENIRTHSEPGVIVLSIFATCFSGAFTDQAIPLAHFKQPGEIQKLASLDAPVFITFTSCSPQESSYESALGNVELNVRDHFLWAFTRVVRTSSLDSWPKFMMLLHQYFAYARHLGSTAAEEGFQEWLSKNPQTPALSLPIWGQLPKFQVVFPTMPSIPSA